jgi:hypothetical protein
MWFLISMGRSDQCSRVVYQMIECGISTHGRLIVNGTEDEAAYRAIILPDQWEIQVLPQNIGVCGAMAKMFRDYPTEDCYSLVCDDEFVETTGFDKRLIEAAGRWGISHGNDRQMTDQPEEWLHTYATYGGDLVRAVGWWPLPGLWHSGFDNTWQVIAREFGLRRYCKDVLTTHINTWNGTATEDETYRIGRVPAETDMARFHQWKDIEWPSLRNRLKSEFR